MYFGGGQNIKVVQDEPPGKERLRGRFFVAPLIGAFLYKIAN